MTELRSTDDGIDPQIRQFIAAMNAAWREHPPLDSLPLSEARRVAEDVRGRFARGGPVMPHTSHHDVPFAQGAVRIRVHDPAPGVMKPGLIYLHGGGWIMFSLDTHDRIMREYAARAGVMVIGIDYSLSPEARFPRAIEETAAVIRWLTESGAPLPDLDSSRLAIGGDSAGAALSLSTCLKLRDAGAPRAIRAMVLNYGCFDSACTAPSFERYGRAEYLWSPDEMQGYWRDYLGDANPRNPLAVPAYADLRDLPPALLVIPECDVLHDDSIAMTDRLRAAGVAAQSIVYPGATHSFLEAVAIAQISDRAFADTARWLRTVLA